MSDTQLLRNLLAVIHGGGGHTEEVGIGQSVKDAKVVCWRLTRERDEAQNDRNVEINRIHDLCSEIRNAMEHLEDALKKLEGNP